MGLADFLSKSKSKAPEEESDDSSKGSLKMIASEILDAIAAKDADALAEALESFCVVADD